MIDDIYCHSVLGGVVAYDISEEGVEVEIGDSLKDQNDDLLHEKIAIVQPDRFYNTKDFATPPKSVDNVVVVKDDEDNFYLYVIELKSTCKTKRINRQELAEKFDTTFKDFLIERFGDVFNGAMPLMSLHAWVVCDPMRLANSNMSIEEYEKKIKSSVIDFEVLMKPVRFKDRIALIRAMLPPPLIEINKSMKKYPNGVMVDML